jgi:hypothetical protein
LAKCFPFWKEWDVIVSFLEEARSVRSGSVLGAIAIGIYIRRRILKTL